ncbi:MAG: hypothetical protein ACYC1Z_14520 [Georgenia sp.]
MTAPSAGRRTTWCVLGDREAGRAVLGDRKAARRVLGTLDA